MELTAEQREKLAEICQRHRLKLIVAHGSYATGKQHPGSDLDIAVLGERPLDFRALAKISGELGTTFGDNRERELDVKSLHGVDPLFRYEVARDSQLLYGDPLDYEEFRGHAFVQYLDSRDLRKLERRLARRLAQRLTHDHAQP